MLFRLIHKNANSKRLKKMFPLLGRDQVFPLQNQTVKNQTKTDNNSVHSELISKKIDLNTSESKPPLSERNSLKVHFSKLEDIYPQVLVVHCSGKIFKSNCLLFHRIFDICIKNLQYFIIVDMKGVVSVDHSVWDYFTSKISKLLKLNGIVLFSGIKKELFSDNKFAKSNICNCASLDICSKVFLHLVNDSEKSMPSESDNKEIFTLLTNLQSSEITAFIDSSPIQNSFEIQNTNVYPKIAAIERKNPEKHSDNNFNLDAQIKSVSNSNAYTLQEKIHIIISQHGPCSFARIKKFLHSREFGSEKISTIGLYNLLRSLNLESLSKRIRYYRSC